MGSFAKTIEFMKQVLIPGSTCLLGEGYWKKRHDPEYIEFLGGLEEDILSLEATVELASSFGAQPIRVEVSTDEEWDAYEGAYADGVRSYCAENLADPKSPD